MNKITVKCPKCRLRFEVPGAPGINELQCNCPRCGTPFTFKVEDENATQSVLQQGQTPRAEQPAVSTPSTHEPYNSAHEPYNSAHEPYTPVNEQPTPPPIPHTVTPPPVPPTTPLGKNIDNARAKRSCMMKLLQAIILVAFILLAVHYCGGSSKSYTSDSVELTNDTDNPSASEQVVDDGPAPAYADSTEDETAPEWIQGTWHVDTDYGGITLRVHGQQVAETSAGETVYGHYRYQNHRLYCDFGAGDGNNDHVYTLKMDTKQIDAGVGQLMTKVE